MDSRKVYSDSALNDPLSMHYTPESESVPSPPVRYGSSPGFRSASPGVRSSSPATASPSSQHRYSLPIPSEKEPTPPKRQRQTLPPGPESPSAASTLSNQPIPLEQKPIPPERPTLNAPVLRSYRPGSNYSSLTSRRSLTSAGTSISTGDRGGNHINIGIDFGTTFSGVAWVILGADSADVNVVTAWPNAPAEAVKVPTKIWYKQGGAIEWGYSVSPDGEPLTWFKLLLLHKKDLPPKIGDSPDLKAANELLKKIGKPLVSVIADYLQRLWECAMIDMRRRNGDSIVDGLPFRVTMTVPANWPDYAQDAMRQAAQEAGITKRRMGGQETKLDLVGEPEAAAIAAFHDDYIRRMIDVGDIVVICDAGGGTADIVTYQVEKLHPAAHLVECAISGEVALCGAIILDEQYKRYIEGMIGHNKLRSFPKVVQRDLMLIWENNIKRQFEQKTPEIVVTIPHEIAKAIKSPVNMFKKGRGSKQLVGDALRHTGEEIRKMFDPVTSDILALIKKQVKTTMRKKQKKPAAIVLVGGLGSNKFLYERLEAEYPASDINLIQPQGAKAWSSICRGAAIKGLSLDQYDDDQVMSVTRVISYISKSHYGIVFKEAFVAGKHEEADRQFDDATNQDLAYNQMRWYVSKGDDVHRGNPITLSWERFYAEDQPRTSSTLTIYQCSSSPAPTRRTSEVIECQTLAFPIVWQSLSVKLGANGKAFRRVQFDLKLTMLGLGQLDFATYVDGRLVAQRNVTAAT